MSCIAGQFNLSGADVPRNELEDMLAAMKTRAPDGDSYFLGGVMAMGQAFLQTGGSRMEAQNRLTLDGVTWITADARIDGRAELVRQLRAAGCVVESDAPHAELILHAFHTFGDTFLNHLLGDFAFALWDGRRRRLICARDHFGVRPLYFARIGETFAFASDIASLLALPRVSRDLDKTAVADFLMVGMCTEAAQTIYRAIRCVPPACRLDVSVSGIATSIYWELPGHRETRYSRESEYVEHFKEVFDQAVLDRVPQGHIALQLSGGMDSTAIAAVASARSLHAGHRATAYHVTCRKLLPADKEWEFTALVAQQLGIPLVCRDVADQPLFGSHTHQLKTAFPVAYPHLGVHRATVGDIADSGARVILSGYSGDAAMAPSQTYYAHLLRNCRFIKFLREAGHHVAHSRSLRGMSLRSIFGSVRPPPAWRPPMPDWIDPELIGGIELASRWDRWWREHQDAVDAPRQFRLPWLQRQFEIYEVHPLPVLVRYPFQDLRLLDFLLSLPNFMLANKAILRKAMHGRLPEAVLTRAKTPLAGDPARTMITTANLDQYSFEQGVLPKMVDRENYERLWQKYLQGHGIETTWWTWLVLQPIALHNWLNQK